MKVVRWPGVSGWVLWTAGLLLAGVYLTRGSLGGGWMIIGLLAIDALYLFATRPRQPVNPVVAPDEVRSLVVIPTKDNASTIVQVIEGCLAHTPHVLVVNDGSTDGTGEIAEQTDAHVVHHKVNRGKGHAIHTALHWALDHDFTHIITLDADAQHKPSDLPTFFAGIKDTPGVIFVGVRDLSTAPGKSQFGRRFSNFWIRAETGVQVGDSQTGYRVYPVKRTLELGLPGGRYEYEVRVLTHALWRGMHVLDLPIDVYYPPEEERVSSFDPFKDNVRISLVNSRLMLKRMFLPPLWFGPGPDRAPERFNQDGGWDGGWRGTRWGWMFWVRALGLVGRWPVYACMTVLVSWFWLFAPVQRRGLSTYLDRMFPNQGSFSRAKRQWQVFYQFAIAIIDRFALLSEGPGAFEILREGVDEAREAVGESGFIVMSSHLGNPEIGAAVLNTAGARKQVHMMRFVADGDPYTEIARAMRPDAMPKVIALNDSDQFAAMKAARVLREGDVVALKADRLVDDRSTEVTFLGEPMQVPMGPFLLAALSGAPVLILGCFKEGASAYRVMASGPHTFKFTSRKSRAEDINRWAKQYMSLLESWVKRYPLQWYNFHDVWDPNSATRQIPKTRAVNATGSSAPAKPTAPEPVAAKS